MDLEYEKIELAQEIIDDLPDMEVKRIINKFELEIDDSDDLKEELKDWLLAI